MFPDIHKIKIGTLVELKNGVRLYVVDYAGGGFFVSYNLGLFPNSTPVLHAIQETRLTVVG